MAVKFAMRVLGFMTGTSLDAVDMAVLETNGEAIEGFGPAGERKLTADTRAVVEAATEAARAWAWDAPRPAIFARADLAIADEHLAAAASFMREHRLSAGDLDLVGFHGQTVIMLHACVALLVRREHEHAVLQQCRGAIVVLAGDAEDVAGGGHRQNWRE